MLSSEKNKCYVLSLDINLKNSAITVDVYSASSTKLRTQA